MSAQSSQLLTQCGSVARTRLNEVVAAALAHIDEDLFALAEKTQKREEQAIYLDAMTRIRENRAGIAQRFDDCFADLYLKKLSSVEKMPAPETSSWGGIELSLVSDSKMENGIAIDRLAKGVRKGADGDEMLGIRARFGHLMQRDDLEDADNPLGPELIFEALRLACNTIPTGNAAKQAMLAAFQPYLRDSINSVYHAVNETLVAHHVLPRIKHNVKTANDPMNATGRNALMQQTGRMPALGNTGRQAALGNSGRNTLLNDDCVEVAARSGWLGGSFGNEPAALNQLLSGLAQGRAAARLEALGMFSDPARFPAGPGAVEVSAALMQSLAQMQSAANLGDNAAAVAPGYLHQAGQLLTAHSTPLDRLTVELVAMVFDFLFATPRLPETVKGVISRLQIVAVKAALLDRSFFARREHPMRRLLDRMAEAGADPLIDCAAEGAVILGKRQIADDLCVNFKDDCVVFAHALESLERLIAAEQQRRTEAAIAPTAKLAAEEAASSAISAARADLALRVLPGTPQFIREFLDHWWVHAITQADLARAADEDSVKTQLVIASDLIWSVEPKKSADVAVLAALLPGMVRGLMRGARTLGLPDASRQAFFGALMQAHTAAIATAKSAPSGAVVAARPTPAEAMRRAPEPMRAPADVWQRQVAALVKGDMVEFSDASEPERCRLAWVSPQQTFYLFIGRGRMRQIDAGQLNALFRQGIATQPGAELPLVDQALATLATDAAVPHAA